MNADRMWVLKALLVVAGSVSICSITSAAGTGWGMPDQRAPVVLIADPNVNRNRVPPPRRFQAMAPGTATFEIEFLPAGSSLAQRSVCGFSTDQLGFCGRSGKIPGIPQPDTYQQQRAAGIR